MSALKQNGPKDFFGDPIKAGNFFIMAFRDGNGAEIKIGRVIKIDGKCRVVARMIAREWGNEPRLQPKESLIGGDERMIQFDSDGFGLPAGCVNALKEVT